MVRTKDRESTRLVDVSTVANSAQALRLIEEAVAGTTDLGPLDLDSGQLLLTQKVLSKINDLLRQHGGRLHTVYAVLPQTQQAALDGGFFVKERPPQSAPVLNGAKARPAAPRGTMGSVDELMEKAFSEFSLELPFEAATDTEPKEKVVVAPKKADDAPVEGGAITAGVRSPEGFMPIAAMEQGAERPTLYHEGTLRSGQVLHYEGNLVIVGDVHGGSEVAATGNILVWGELRGIAHAGIGGDTTAQIRALKIEAIQLRIAETIARRPDRIFYHRQEDTGIPLPEVARIESGEIKIFNDVIGK